MTCMACEAHETIASFVRKSATFSTVWCAKCKTCMTVCAAGALTEVQLGGFYRRFYISDSRRSVLASALGWFRGLSERAPCSLVTYAMDLTSGLGLSGSLVAIGSGNGMLRGALRVVVGSGSDVVRADASRDVRLLYPRSILCE
jgi:ferredoxin